MGKDTAFYLRVWENRLDHCCEECGQFLPHFSPMFISHIISKGANAALRHDVRNANLLCQKHHYQWEFGDRKTMKIYPRNKQLKEMLTLEYYERKNLPGNRSEDGTAPDTDEEGEESL